MVFPFQGNSFNTNDYYSEYLQGYIRAFILDPAIGYLLTLSPIYSRRYSVESFRRNYIDLIRGIESSSHIRE